MASCPLYTKHTIEGSTTRISIDNAKIDGPELIVSNKDLAEPIAVSYAYTRHPQGNLLYNKEGQAVGPFSMIGYGPELKADAAGK